MCVFVNLRVVPVGTCVPVCLHKGCESVCVCVCSHVSGGSGCGHWGMPGLGLTRPLMGFSGGSWGGGPTGVAAVSFPGSALRGPHGTWCKYSNPNFR